MYCYMFCWLWAAPPLKKNEIQPVTLHNILAGLSTDMNAVCGRVDQDRYFDFRYVNLFERYKLLGDYQLQKINARFRRVFWRDTLALGVLTYKAYE